MSTGKDYPVAAGMGSFAALVAASLIQAAVIALLGWAGLRVLHHPVNWWAIWYLTAAALLLVRCMFLRRSS